MKKIPMILCVFLLIWVVSAQFINAIEKTDGPIKEYQAHNDSLEQSPEYKKIIGEVMREVYTTYAKEEIESDESFLIREDSNSSYYHERKQELEKAKALLPLNPEAAAKVFFQLGCCHRLWYLQKTILKDKYGITWYTPSEVNPDIIFD